MLVLISGGGISGLALLEKIPPRNFNNTAYFALD
jgi:hypothetical protein